MNDSPASPTFQRLCSEMIALRERNDRQHKLFEQTLGATRSELAKGFGQFAADAQHAYQQLRQELTGEKRQSLALLTMLLDLSLDLERIAEGQPENEGVAVAARKAQATLGQLGVHRFEATFGDAYQPALHERVGSCKVEGVGPQRIARQIEPGYASPSPDFLLKRAKVLISE